MLDRQVVEEFLDGEFEEGDWKIPDITVRKEQGGYMGRYRCLNCDYSGDELIYQFNDYTYCIASNDEEPEFVDDCPSWVKEQGLGDAEIGQPVGCPECHAWGVDTFEEIG